MGLVHPVLENGTDTLLGQRTIECSDPKIWSQVPQDGQGQGGGGVECGCVLTFILLLYFPPCVFYKNCCILIPTRVKASSPSW